MPGERWRAAARVRIACAIVALACGGCTFTHRETIPQPVVEPPPARRIEANVGVRFEPGLAERSGVASGPGWGWTSVRSVTPVGRSVEALCDRLLPSVFARTKPLSATASPEGVDAVLDVRLAAFELRSPSGFDATACRASIALGWELSTPTGEPIARWTTETVGEQQPPPLGSCIGDAVALALQDAGRAFVDRLLSDAAVRAWTDRRGIAVVAAPEPPRAPPPPPSEPEGAPEPWATAASEPGPVSPAAPRPVVKAAPQTPGASALRAAVGWFSPRGTPGALDDPSGGIALLLGGTYRPRPWLGVDLDLTYGYGQFSSSTAPPPGTFETKGSRMSLSSLGLGAGVRGIAPLGILRPWAGGGVTVLVSKLTLAGTTLGFPGEVAESGVTGGVYAAAGLDLAVEKTWLLGGQCRWLFAEQDFGRLSAGQTGSIGGRMCVAAVSRTWP
ncbi:hypothetical protein [Anaeromyxobacter oryzae]|uniref:Lipoprotein n=1 Tax=Anaeromyxobacter oryzae TaxID=2918170 RepID=A0ABM7X060_9BACT|nr:hypothetical protein [Anaeromyxobacter oryzae]BDG05096.1 hypothetical protein AMOR_40920 [Anaeromyxobacter oryzae]